ncbi:hypothetical protein BDR22DRAFT_978061 [Usnea florida]
MSSTTKQLPESVTLWRDLAVEWKATGGMDELGSPVKVSSASNFGFERFLGLQVLYNFPKPRSRLPVAITSQFPSIAGYRLENVPGYDFYLNEIDKVRRNGISGESIANTRVSRSLAAFVNVWQLQRHVLVGDQNAADVSKISKIKPISPVAERTRAKIRRRQLEQAATPTPASRAKNIPLTARMASLTFTGEGEIGDNGLDSHVGLRMDALDQESAEHGEVSSDDDENDNETDDDDEEIDLEQELAVGDPNDEVYAPTPGPGGRYIRDEQTVNVFILALLSTITATTVPFETRWVAERNAMVFRKNVWYVARTDGHLRDRKNRSLSLIEVKPRKTGNDISIRVQETAQMAAWISQENLDFHDPNKSCEIFLLSQDKDEIFLTFPYFTRDYGKPYKDVKDLKEKNFLIMREYGPFLLDSREHMNHILVFLHNYTLHKSKL